MCKKRSRVCEYKEVENPYLENELPDLDYGGCRYLGYAGNREGTKAAEYYFKCFCGNVFKDGATNVIKKVNPCCGCSKDKIVYKESSSLFELHMKEWNPDTEDALIKKLPIFGGIVGREKIIGYSIVDEDVYDVWSRIMWINDGSGYVIAKYSKDNCRRLGIEPPVSRKSLSLRLHRCVLGLGHSVKYKGDHVNGDVRDNRSCNLRVATDAENHYNTKVINNSHGLIGIKFYRDSSINQKRWCAQIQYKGKQISKSFHTKDEAVFYRDLMAVDLHGEFATLNYPENLEEYRSKLHTLHYK